MTNPYGDGFERATEPGPDVEWQLPDGTWAKRTFSTAWPLLAGFKYRRQIKLRAGECSRMQDETIVDDLVQTGSRDYPWYSAKTGFTWTNEGLRTKGNLPEFQSTNIVAHIEKQPKENSMTEQVYKFGMIEAKEVTIGCQGGSKVYLMTLDQAIAIGEEAKAMKAEAEIKVGDFVMVHEHRLGRVINCNEGFMEVSGFVSGLAATACRKIHGTPAELAFLKSVFDGAK